MRSVTVFGRSLREGELSFSSFLFRFPSADPVPSLSRFGARSLRTCLESPHTTLRQKVHPFFPSPSRARLKLIPSSCFSQKRVAVAVVLNSIPLATSPNGALLVTWLVVSFLSLFVGERKISLIRLPFSFASQDTSSLPGRFRLLAPRFAPHLAHLCTHKLASTAVLRIINQRSDLDGELERS